MEHKTDRQCIRDCYATLREKNAKLRSSSQGICVRCNQYTKILNIAQFFLITPNFAFCPYIFFDNRFCETDVIFLLTMGRYDSYFLFLGKPLVQKKEVSLKHTTRIFLFRRKIFLNQILSKTEKCVDNSKQIGQMGKI